MLTVSKIQGLKKPGRYAHLNGLYLQVSRTGSKSWIYRYQQSGKRHEIGLGSYKYKSLSDAHKEAQKLAYLRTQGVDPKVHKINQKHSINVSNEWTFERCAKKYIEAHKSSWSNEKHAAQWQSTLDMYAKKTIGHLPVSQINTNLILEILEPIWESKSETASRLRGRIENILDWATVRGFRTGPNPAMWRGNLSMLLPAISKIKTRGHHPALPYSDITDLMTTIRSKESISAIALELLILTAVRTNEIIKAKWEEIDLNSNIWTIPAERMKSKRDHRVPLSEQAVEILMNHHRINEWLFPGNKEDRPLSNMAMLTFLQRELERPDLTVHGFRSTFRDWAAEVSNYPKEIAESALAHVLSDKTEAAYQRGDLLEKRRKMMQAWADYCDLFPLENILPMRQK